MDFLEGFALICDKSSLQFIIIEPLPKLLKALCTNCCQCFRRLNKRLHEILLKPFTLKFKSTRANSLNSNVLV